MNEQETLINWLRQQTDKDEIKWEFSKEPINDTSEFRHVFKTEINGRKFRVTCKCGNPTEYYTYIVGNELQFSTEETYLWYALEAQQKRIFNNSLKELNDSVGVVPVPPTSSTSTSSKE